MVEENGETDQITATNAFVLDWAVLASYLGGEVCVGAASSAGEAVEDFVSTTDGTTHNLALHTLHSSSSLVRKVVARHKRDRW